MIAENTDMLYMPVLGQAAVTITKGAKNHTGVIEIVSGKMNIVTR